MRHSVGAYTRMCKTDMCGVLLSQIYVDKCDISYCYPSRRWLEEAGQPGGCTAALETFPSAPWLVQFSPLTTRGTLWNRIGPSIKKNKLTSGDCKNINKTFLWQFIQIRCVCLTWLTDDNVIGHGRAVLVAGDALVNSLIRLCLLSADVNDQSTWVGLHDNFEILFRIEMSAITCPWKARLRRVKIENQLRQHACTVTLQSFFFHLQQH